MMTEASGNPCGSNKSKLDRKIHMMEGRIEVRENCDNCKIDREDNISLLQARSNTLQRKYTYEF